MTLHVHGNFLTPFGIRANNMQENDGNYSPMRHLIWEDGLDHTTQSSESISKALKETMQSVGCSDEFVKAMRGWMDTDKKDGEKGERADLGFCDAVSVTPWPGTVSFHAAAPGSNPNTTQGESNSAPYMHEEHACRMQFPLTYTPKYTKGMDEHFLIFQAIVDLDSPGGNHTNHNSPWCTESAILQITERVANNRLQYCFDENGDIPGVVEDVEDDILDPEELVLVGKIAKKKGIFGKKKVRERIVNPHGLGDYMVNILRGV